MVQLAHPLVFIRHGQTDWNKEGRLQGSRDIPINALGQMQARRNGEKLAELFAQQGWTPDSFAFVASPLGRCRNTMELVRTTAKLDPVTDYALDPRLREITFGDWEGKTFSEINQDEPQSVVARKADKWGYVPPGGENYAMLTARIAPWLTSLDRPTVAVSHGGVSRAVRGLLFDLPQDEIPSLDVPQDQLYVVVDGQGYWV